MVPQRCLRAHFEDKLLWASKFTMAKIECSFEMGKQTPLG